MMAGMGMLALTLAYAPACAVFSLARTPGTVRDRFRARGWGLLLLVLALLTLGFNVGYGWPSAAVLLAGLVLVVAPGWAARTVPYALFALGAYGIWLEFGRPIWAIWDIWFYGLVPRPYGSFLVLPQAAAFLAAGVWGLVRVNTPGAGLVRGLGAALRGRGPVPATLLLPVFLLWVAMMNPQYYLGNSVIRPVVVFLLLLTVLTVLSAPRVASIAAVAGMTAYGGYGVLIMIYFPTLQAALFGVVAVTSEPRALLAGAQGLLVLLAALRLWPLILAESPERVLAERASWLSQRVQRLTQTRSDAADAAVAELRRIERDLHDGAQARLVALGMSLRAAEQLMSASPEAALVLIAEARETSSRALSDLRDLVRGIYPPVLADRGLADALRSLALDAPLPVDVDVEVDPLDNMAMPLAAAVYFGTAEALANAVRHSGATRVLIKGRHTGSALRVEVTDDGRGGADSSRGTGLAGVERRLATFDGILAVSSPVGGPTIVIIEVPCASSSVKTSIS
jgi:signal transduction histidine kinase